MNNHIIDLIPKKDMEAWLLHDPDTSAGGNINDASGKGRHVTQLVNPPLILGNAWRGQPAWYFDGTNNPLKWSGSVTVKQVVIIAAFEESSFASARGLFTGISSGDWLTTSSSGTAFVTPTADYKYRKADVLFADNDWQAPTRLEPLVLTVSNPLGVAMDGLQIGQSKANTATKNKGYFFELAAYSRALTAEELEMWDEYAALKYKIWRRVASGMDVWPFRPDWTAPAKADKLVLASTSVSGSIKSRAKSLAKIGIDAKFTNRFAEDFNAGYSFWDSKYPGTPFIYRDYSYETPRDLIVRFVSGFNKDAQRSFHDIDYSWSVMSENVNDIWDGGTIPLNALLFEDQQVLFDEEI